MGSSSPHCFNRAAARGTMNSRRLRPFIGHDRVIESTKQVPYAVGAASLRKPRASAAAP